MATLDAVHPATTCPSHPTSPSLAVCQSCHAAMCDVCWAFVMDGAPACAACVYRRERGSHRAASWGIVLAALVLGGFLFLSPRAPDDLRLLLRIAFILLTVSIVGLTLRSVHAHKLLTGARRREVGDSPPDVVEGSQAPYRGGRFRHITRRMIPALSGRNTALAMLLLLAGTALAFPAALHLPRWVEAEVVIGSWWLIGVVAFTGMLYRGTRMREDHAFVIKWGLPEFGGGSSGNWLDGMGPVDGEGCVALIAVVVALVAAFAVALVVIELVIPVVFFLLYWGIVKGIGRVLNDKHDCAGALGRSLGWGAAWATLYTAPPALLAVAYHYSLLHR